MPAISNLDKFRVKVFCAFVDIWAARMDRKDDPDLARKIGDIATMMEEIKRMVLSEGATVTPMMVQTDALSESDNLSRWKTDEQILKKIRNSIEINGLKNPPVVRCVNGVYEIICGSLQYEACKMLNMERIPVLLKNCGSVKAEEFALLDAFSKTGLQNLDPCLINAVLRFYNQLLN